MKENSETENTKNSKVTLALLRLAKFPGFVLCGMGFHKRFEMIETECFIGIGCPRCKAIPVGPIRWKNKIPPPRRRVESEEDYAQVVKEYLLFVDKLDEDFRKKLKDSLKSN